MAPLYLPGLDENGAVANLYPASWICSKKESKPGTIGITAVYNFVPGTKIHYCLVQFFSWQTGAGYNISPAVKFFNNENKKRI